MSPFQRFIGAVVAATVLGAAVGVPIILSPGGGGGGTTTTTTTTTTGGGGGGGAVTSAQLWVDPTSGGSCTRAGGGQAYSHAVTCGSWPAAYAKAQTGDVIGVACAGASACTYNDQTFSTNNASLTGYVTFEPEQGVTPQLGCYTTLANDGSTFTHGQATINVADNSCWTGAPTPYSVEMDVSEFSPSACSGTNGTTQFTGCVGGLGTAVDSWAYPATVYRPGRIQTNGVSWIKVDGFSIIQLGVNAGSNHIFFTNGSMLFFGLAAANDVSITYTHEGPDQNGHANAGPHNNATNVLFDHDVFDSINSAGVVNQQTYNDFHGESFYIGYGDGLVISNSSFINWGEFAIFISPGQEPTAPGTQQWMFDHVHIFNNFFGLPNTHMGANRPIESYDDPNVHNWSATLGIENWLIEHNTFAFPSDTSFLNYPGGMHNVVVRNNYGLKGWSSFCSAANTWDDNKWTTTGCTGDLAPGAFSVVNSSSTTAPDLHLVAGSSAIGQGDPASLATAPTDIDGCARTSPPDVGADQFGCP